MAEFEELLARIAKRPALYVGQCSVSRVANYLDGYCDAMEALGCPVIPLQGWMQWIELRFGICSPAWHWSRILLHHYGSAQAAIEALPSLYNEFETDRARDGVDGIDARHDEAFRNTLGGAPESTTTIDSFD
jgi:hypothetical protein